jgi:hypothetical protein
VRGSRGFGASQGERAVHQRAAAALLRSGATAALRWLLLSYSARSANAMPRARRGRSRWRRSAHGEGGIIEGEQHAPL